MNAKPCLLAALFLVAAGTRAEEPAPVDPPAVEEVAPPDAPAARAAAGSRGTVDHLELDATAITGNRELPKVMVIVPWKKADLGELRGKPARSLIDEILAPVDRDVFRREIGYFETLSEGIQDGASQGENPVTPETARP